MRDWDFEKQLQWLFALKEINRMEYGDPQLKASQSHANGSFSKKIVVDGDTASYYEG